MNTLISAIQNIRSLAQPDPARDWIIILICSIAALTGIVVWNVWTFDIVVDDQIIRPHGATVAPAPVTPSLSKVEPFLEKRAAEEARYASQYYRFIDPSK